ncbi:hypothetical protein [Lysinibacillus telephonicus]|uniref:Uncharacterized protein n=1 Tax=Lysinibacillus telephonicus TaxID=1714840 RepID=A0A431UXH4_9BACI|nr:hypothetical protein [Lysinibacillus telephonicus]RTQ96104.1 hypothetical protein EKG35_01680 [Lysinibacillus telephonicus]
MNFPFSLILCIVLMGIIACFLYYLGKKISYSFILYNPSITLGFSVIFFLVKMIFSQQNQLEYSIDVIITVILLFVWIVALLEAVIIDIFENGEEMLNDIRLVIGKELKKEMKILVSTSFQNWKRIIVKSKNTT